MIKIFNNINLESGDIEVMNSIITEDNTLESAVFLSLYGGNLRDSSRPSDDNIQWWGNTVAEPEEQYRSKFQWTVDNIAITTGTLTQIGQAVRHDLAWIEGDIDVSVQLIAVSHIKVIIFINQKEFIIEATA